MPTFLGGSANADDRPRAAEHEDASSFNCFLAVLSVGLTL